MKPVNGEKGETRYFYR